MSNFATVEDFISARRGSEAAKADEIATFSAKVEDIKARAKVDFTFFAGIVAPEVMRLPFCGFYLGIFNLLTSQSADPNIILRFALGLPRGFIKTTFLKILTVYFIVYDLNFFILVVCATEPKACAFIEDVDAMLSKPSVENIYGRWTASKIVDNHKKKKGILNGHLRILLPLGSGSAVRGANENNKRPDLIICDDIQGREEALSPVQNTALIEWFTSTLIKCIDIYGHNRRIIYLGNMFPGECLLKKLKDNPEWVSLITGAILSDGNSLWPELKSLDVLFAEYRHDASMGLGHVWFAEVQNDPLDAKYRLLAEPIPVLDEHYKNLEHDACFLTIDPAGFRRKSDHNVIATHKMYSGFPVCTRLKGDIWDPKTTVAEAIKEALLTGASIIGIESTGYQQSLCFWMEQFLIALNITWITVVELKTNNKSKESRISDYIKEMLAGNCGMSDSARVLFTYYAGLYKLGQKDNRDDYLDAPAYQKQILTEYAQHLMPARGNQFTLDTMPAVIDVDIGVG